MKHKLNNGANEIKILSKRIKLYQHFVVLNPGKYCQLAILEGSLEKSMAYD